MSFKTVVFVLGLFHLGGPSMSLAGTTAEKLGFSSDAKLLIIHADDIGMSHSVNRASFQAFQKGIVSSGSVMLPCPWVNEVKDGMKQNPNLDLGVHATLTSEWRSLKWSPISRSPRLADSLGYFWEKLTDVINHATDDDVYREVEAQIQRAFAMGIKPTHVDSHMGVHFARQDYLEAVLAVSKKYRIPPMIVRWSEELESEAKRRKIDPEPIRRTTEKAEKEGFVVLDHLITFAAGNSIDERHRSYATILKNLKPGVTQLIVHLGFADDEWKGIMTDQPEGLERRYADYLYFTNPNTKSLLQKLGIQVINWKDLGRIAWQK